jgi:hypothetical protein
MYVVLVLLSVTIYDGHMYDIYVTHMEQVFFLGHWHGSRDRAADVCHSRTRTYACVRRARLHSYEFALRDF